MTDAADRRRRRLTVAIGTASSVLFTWIALRGVDLETLRSSAVRWHPSWALAYVLAVCGVQLLRLLRWTIILRPLGERRTARSMAIGAVGLSAIFFLPARLGELYRPVMIADRDGVSVGEATAVVALERLLDGVLVGAMLIVVGALVDAELADASRLRFAGAALGGGFFGAGVVIAVAARFASTFEPLVLRVTRRAPAIGQAIVSLIERFRFALMVLPRQPAFLAFVAISALVWVAGGLAIIALLHSVSLDAPLSAAFVVFSALTVGMLVPAAPTSVGTAHAAVTWALGLYGVAREPALAAAIILHGAQVLANGAVGAAGAVAGGLDRTRFRAVRANEEVADARAA